MDSQFLKRTYNAEATEKLRNVFTHGLKEKALRLLTPHLVSNQVYFATIHYWVKHRIKELVQEGADPNVETTHGGTRPLTYAMENKDINLMYYLLQRGADPNQLLGSASILMYTATCNLPEAVQALVSYGANPNHINDFGSTVLTYAHASSARPEILNLLSKQKIK